MKMVEIKIRVPMDVETYYIRESKKNNMTLTQYIRYLLLREKRRVEDIEFLKENKKSVEAVSDDEKEK